MKGLARRHGSRVAIVLLAIAIAWVTGVRTGRVKAFTTGAFSGEGRIQVSVRPAYDDELIDADVAMTYTTFGSRHGEGLVIETSFLLPETDREVSLVLDLDRSNARRTWDSSAPNGRVELTLDGDGDQRALIARGVAGELSLEAAFVRGGVMGFRIGGRLTVTAADGRWLEVVLLIETTPSAEEVAGDWAPVDPCERGDCWVDQGAEPGCASHREEEVYVEPAVGCASDWDDDDGWDDDSDWDDWGDDDSDWDDWGDDDWDDNGNDSSDGVDDNGNPTD